MIVTYSKNRTNWFDLPKSQYDELKFKHLYILGLATYIE